jgi:hypothetical protein
MLARYGLPSESHCRLGDKRTHGDKPVYTMSAETAAIDSTPARAPGQEFHGCAVVGPARVRAADVGGEKFKDAHRRAFAGGNYERRHRRQGRSGRAGSFGRTHALRRPLSKIRKKPQQITIGISDHELALAVFDLVCAIPALLQRDHDLA